MCSVVACPAHFGFCSRMQNSISPLSAATATHAGTVDGQPAQKKHMATDTRLAHLPGVYKLKPTLHESSSESDDDSTVTSRRAKPKLKSGAKSRPSKSSAGDKAKAKTRSKVKSKSLRAQSSRKRKRSDSTSTAAARRHRMLLFCHHLARLPSCCTSKRRGKATTRLHAAPVLVSPAPRPSRGA